jgi:hypothetical protein
MKNSNYTFGNLTRDLLACNTVPQPTVPPHAPHNRCVCVCVDKLIAEVATYSKATREEYMCSQQDLTLSNPIFLPLTYSPALIYFGRERGWSVTCNYPTVLKGKNRNRKSTTCSVCWLKSVLREEKRQAGSDSGTDEQTQQKSVGRLSTLERNRKIIMSDEVRHGIGKG